MTESSSNLLLDLFLTKRSSSHRRAIDPNIGLVRSQIRDVVDNIEGDLFASSRVYKIRMQGVAVPYKRVAVNDASPTQA